MRGSIYFGDTDSALDSRNPFALTKPDYSSRLIVGNVGGPINSKTSYYLDFERRDINDNADINALELSPTTLIPFQNQQVILTPNARTEVSGRIDYAINANNTLVIRLQDESSNQTNAGLGVTTLPSRAYNSSTAEKVGYVTETAVINAKIINETRFRMQYQTSNSNGNNTIPTISVASSFSGGGAGIGNSASTPRTLTRFRTIPRSCRAFTR